MPALLTERREFAKSVIDRAVRKTLKGLCGKRRRAFQSVLWNVQHRSELLRPSRYEGRIGVERPAKIVQGLFNLAGYQKAWLRPVEEWDPTGVKLNPLPLFSSLAHHLLANYPVPPVLLQSWFNPTADARDCGQYGFYHVGRGGSVRTARFPVLLSRRMAHEFTQAPVNLTVPAALRWAQVKGLGGGDGLAAVVADSAFVGHNVDDDFVASVVQFFMNHPRTSQEAVRSIVAYVHDQRNVHRMVIIGADTEIALDPPQPHFSMKGRTVGSLLRLVAAWRMAGGAAPDTPDRRVIRWSTSGPRGMRRVDETGTVWTVRELLDSDDLVAEGAAMHNCVAGYTYNCAKGRSSIWSLAVETPTGRERALTVEVCFPARVVVQAKAPCNHEPGFRAREMLEFWAKREGLQVPV